MGLLFILIAKVLGLYYYLLIARVLLSWFQVNWHDQPYATLAQVTDPYLNAFRFIPPMGMFDLSPMVAIFVLFIVQNMLYAMAGAV